MKRLVILLLLLSIFALCCCDSGDIGSTNNGIGSSTNNDVDSTNMCYTTLYYQGPHLYDGKKYTYTTVSIGVDNNENGEWTTYDQKLFVSTDNINWVDTSTTAFSVSRYATTFYLKAITYNVNKNGKKCMSISVYREHERISREAHIL